MYIICISGEVFHLHIKVDNHAPDVLMKTHFVIEDFVVGFSYYINIPLSIFLLAILYPCTSEKTNIFDLYEFKTLISECIWHSCGK